MKEERSVRDEYSDSPRRRARYSSSDEAEAEIETDRLSPAKAPKAVTIV